MNILSLPIITTALALIISWALFAVFCSILHEAIAQLKAERGRFMRKYLYKQLRDLPNGVNWASLLYLHGTIDLLSRDADKPTNEIEPALFAKTLIEIVGTAHIVQMQIPMLQQNLLVAKNDNRNAGSQPQQFVNQVQNYFSHATLFNFKAATQVLKPGSVVSMLTQAINNAELNANAGSAASAGQWVTEAEIYNHLVIFIEKWYVDFTGRISLWYKKKTRQRLFLLGCLLALVMNIDSIQLFSFYTANPVVREAMINYYQKNADTLSRLANKLQYRPAGDLNTDSILAISSAAFSANALVVIDSTLKNLRTTVAPGAEILNNAAAREREDSIAEATAASSYAGASKNNARHDTAYLKPLPVIHNSATDTLQMLSYRFLQEADSLRSTANLPVGFHYSVFISHLPFFSYQMILKIVGILISGIAASFGGPFWFDVLRKIYTRK